MDGITRARMQFWIAAAAVIVIAITSHLTWHLPFLVSSKKAHFAIVVDGFLIMARYASPPSSGGQAVPQAIFVSHDSLWYYRDWLPTLARRCYVNGDYVAWRLDFPLWPLLLPPVFIAYRALRAVRRLSLPGCKHCGYSREGLAADAACPECGNTFPSL